MEWSLEGDVETWGGGIKSCIYTDGNDPGERGNWRCGKGVDMYWTDPEVGLRV